MRQEGENHTTEEEHDGIRNFETLRERGQPGDQEHKKEKCELEVVNACGLHGAVSRESRLTREYRMLHLAKEGMEHAFMPYTVAAAKLAACACSCSAWFTQRSKISRPMVASCWLMISGGARRMEVSPQ